MKKQTMIFFSAALIMTAAVIMIPSRKKAPEEPKNGNVAASSVSERIDYFASHGWEVE